MKISVVLATYNGQKYLREQLESLYSQSMCPDEIIVVDDCSSDSTLDILNEFHENRGLTFYINEKNLGVNKSFEKAIGLASGDFVALCDQDDVWFNNKIETLYNRISMFKQDIPVVVSSQKIDVNHDCIPIKSKYLQHDTYAYFDTILREGVSQGCTLMLNRCLINHLHVFPEFMMYDLYISLSASLIGVKYNLGVPLMYYRHHSNNVVGKEAQSYTLFDKISNKVMAWKNDLIIPSTRYACLSYLRYDYGEEILEDTLPLLNCLEEYSSSSLTSYKRIKLMFSIKELSFREKVLILLKGLIVGAFRKNNF